MVLKIIFKYNINACCRDLQNKLNIIMINYKMKKVTIHRIVKRGH